MQNGSSRRVALVGGDIYEGDLAEKTEGWEKWSVNNLYAAFPETKWDRWYELHVIERKLGRYYRRGYPNYPIRGEQSVYEYLKRLNELDCDVYMRKTFRIIKKSRIFPFEAIIRDYGSYMGCSFAWMLAHALYEGVEEVGFFGINLDGNEYYYQRPSVEYLMGIARERGVKLVVDETSNLLKADYIYAYKEDFGKIYALHGTWAAETCRIIFNGIQSMTDKIYGNTE